jgi:hypothetical protein
MFMDFAPPPFGELNYRPDDPDGTCLARRRHAAVDRHRVRRTVTELGPLVNDLKK